MNLIGTRLVLVVIACSPTKCSYLNWQSDDKLGEQGTLWTDLPSAIVCTSSVLFGQKGWITRNNPYRFARAARAGGEEALRERLAETGSHINQPSLLPRNMGRGVLYFAIEQDRPTPNDDRDAQRTIEVLIEAGADVQFVNVTDWTNSTTYDTPLHQAASRNSTAAAIPLIAAGADTNALNNDEESPLDNTHQLGCE